MGYINVIDSTQSKSRERFRGNLTRIYTDRETGMTMFASQKNRSTSLETSISQDSQINISTSSQFPPNHNSEVDFEGDRPNETSCLFRVTVSNDIEVLLDHF